MSATQAIAMIGSSTGPSWGSGVFSYVQLTLVSVIVLLVVLLVFLLRRSIRSERRIAAEARRVVDALEALRSGGWPVDVTTAPHSAIGPIGDAIGRMSSEMIGASSFRPPANFAGQLTIRGVDMPPSCTQCLYSLKGVLETLAHSFP